MFLLLISGAAYASDGLVGHTVSVDTTGTNWVYSDTVGGSELPLDSVVQILSAGANETIDPPGTDGLATGDDSIVPIDAGTGKILAIAGYFAATGSSFPAQTKIYARAFNSTSIGAATKYGDSELVTTQADADTEPPPTTLNLSGFATDKDFPPAEPTAAAVPFSAVLHAEGQDLGGVKDYDATIGVGTAAAEDAPPAPPSYSVKLQTWKTDWSGPYLKDIRALGETSYQWIVDLNPHGSIAPPIDRSSTLSWDPSQFAEGDYSLQAGYPGALGDVVVADMKTTTSYEATGGDTSQYFTLTFTPAPPAPDEEEPVITLTGDATVTITVKDAYTDAGATAVDNVDGDVTASIVVSGDTVDVNTPGTYVIRYNVSDAASNPATEVVRTVTVLPDTTDPVITLTGEATVTISAGGSYTEAGATALDNVDGDISVNVTVGGDTVDANIPGIYVVTYNVSDAASNSATEVTRTVTVVDDGMPVITLTGETTVTIAVGGSYTEAGATALDNVDGDISVYIDVGGATVDVDTPGTYVITYNVSDAATNEATEVTRTVIVIDDVLPVISLTGDATVTISAGDTYTDAGATASDDVDGDITGNIIVGGDDVDVNTPGTYVITYNVSDAASNAAAEITRSVTVIDDGNPVITLTGDATVTITVKDVYTDAGATAVDNVDGDVTASIVVSGDTVDINTPGTYVIRYNVSDAAGNAAAEVTRTVTVLPDTTDPVTTLTGEATVTITVKDAYTDAGATAVDNVDGDLTANIVVSGDTVDVNTPGTYVIRYNVSDTAGNVATEVTRTVTVLPDTTDPVITLTGEATVTIDIGDSYTDAGASASDSIDGDLSSSISVGGDTVDINTPGTYVITYDVSDAAGNDAAQVARTVIVRPDTTRPVITLTGETAVTITDGDSYTEAGATASDNVDGDLTADIVVGGDAVDTTTSGTYVITYNVSDAAGNAAIQVTRTVTVITDAVVPVITLLGDAVIEISLGDTYTDAGATALDDVDGDLTDDIVVGGDVVDTAAGGTYTITYDVSDAAGNAAVRVTRMVTVIAITGVVQDVDGAPLENARILAFLPLDSEADFEERYEAMSTDTGSYTISLPLGASQDGWTVVASLTGYVSVSQADQAVGIVNFATADDKGLQPKRAITLATATASTEDVAIEIVGDPVFTAIGQITVDVTDGNSNVDNYVLLDGKIQVTYNLVEDFTVLISTDTSSLVFSYVDEDKDLEAKQGEIDASGGVVDISDEAGQPAMVEVPAGGVTKENVTIEMKQVPRGEVTTSNSGSPLYVYEITAIDNTTGEALSDDEIKRIEITLPIDLTEINPDDIENGIFTIYQADSRLELGQAGGGTPVPVDRIIDTDYVGDGQVGSVLFWVDHLSVFGIGGPISIKLVDQSDDSAGGCFVNTAAHGYTARDDSRALLPAALIVGFMLVVALLIGKKGRFRKVAAGLAAVAVCVFLLVNTADAQDEKGKAFYVEISGLYVVEDTNGEQTIAKFSGPISIDFDDSWGGQLVFGHIYDDMISFEAMLEYIAQFESPLGNDGKGESEMEVVNGSVNAKISCPALNRVKPYIIGGVGILKAFEDISYDGATSRQNDYGVSFRAGGGVDLAVSDTFSVGLEVAYVSGVDDVDHVKYTTVSFGLGYRF